MNYDLTLSTPHPHSIFIEGIECYIIVIIWLTILLSYGHYNVYVTLDSLW